MPQIGGLVFGILILFFCWFFDLAPHWYIICGLITIALGSIDDIHKLTWKIKLTIQLILIFYLLSIFLDQFDTIKFYTIEFSISKISLSILSVIWFVGIYNAINLLDGLDGLAGGFMFMICSVLALSHLGNFSELNGIFSILILSFLIFNQRPAKLFMGDAGSLFLGYHIAVLPLINVGKSEMNILDMTPFVIAASYLIADTTRVFITRIADKKSPMTADTIHFHHLILNQSGSYLASIGIIYLLTLFSCLMIIISTVTELSTNYMLIHIGIILLFILTPPVETYVPIITRIIGPFYTWQKSTKILKPYFPRTLFTLSLLIGLITSILFEIGITNLLSFSHGLALIILFIFILFNRKEIISKYVILVAIQLLYIELFWTFEFNIIAKIFSVLLITSYIIFTFEKRIGSSINNFSAIDLLIFLLCVGGVILSLIGLDVSFWFFLIMISLWLNMSFIIGRLISFK